MTSQATHAVSDISAAIRKDARFWQSHVSSSVFFSIACGDHSLARACSASVVFIHHGPFHACALAGSQPLEADISPHCPLASAGSQRGCERGMISREDVSYQDGYHV